MKRRQRTSVKKPPSPRLIDGIFKRGRLDKAIEPLLQDVHRLLAENVTHADVTLDGAQAMSVLAVLGALLGPARDESATAKNRAGNIALDYLYRTEWLQQGEKTAIGGICDDWKLGRTQVITAKQTGSEHATRVMSVMIGTARRGDRLPHLETFLEGLRPKLVGRLRSR